MPENQEPSLPHLSPSEEFARAHPDFIQPTVNAREWDPNARRSESLRGSGGGFAAAVAGELTMPSKADSIVPVDESTMQDDSEVSDEPVPMPDHIKKLFDAKNDKKFSINDLPLPEDSGGADYRKAKSQARRPGVI